MSLELRIFLAPALIGLASLVGRRWGPTVSGWLVGLPFTSGPVIFFLALDHGAAFATAAATGILAGAISDAVFALAYGWSAFRWEWWRAAPVAVAGFLISTLLLNLLFLVAVAAVSLAFVWIRPMAAESEPAYGEVHTQPRRGNASGPPAWDLAARMVIAAVFVLLLTGLAPALGPQLAGLLAPFPLYASILVIFAHQQQGPRDATRVLRGVLLGLFAFAGFFLSLSLLLGRMSIAGAFISAIVVTLLVEGVTLWLIRRGK
jgi:uncharacterized membrane protein (GlpM family)